MTFEQVCILLTLLGGTVFGTFSICWKVFHEFHDKKK